MEKGELAKSSAVTLGLVALAVAAPALVPVLALASKDYFGEVLSSLFITDDTKESLGKITVNAVADVLLHLSASAAEKIPEALSRAHNFHLETALATAYLESLNVLSNKIEKKGDTALHEQSERVIPLLKTRIERALKEEGPDLLFPVQRKQSGLPLPTALAFADRLSPEDLILTLVNTDKMNLIVADDIEITIRRWMNEERAHQQGRLGLVQDDRLPEPLRSFLPEELLAEVPHRLGEVVNRDKFKKAWIAFERAHLQAILHTVKNLEGTHEALIKKIEELTKLEELVNGIADKLSDFLSNARLPQVAKKELLGEYQSYLVALEGSLYRKIDESTERLSREGNESEQRLSGQITEVLEAIRIGKIIIPTERLHQLPAPPLDFTGREDERHELFDQVRNGLVIFGLHGMGGVGKTALALKLADVFKQDYRDAQFYLDLKGVAPRDGSGSRQGPLSPADVMWHVINSYDDKAERPNDVEKLRAWYYSLLNDQRALLLLDNAKDEAQIAPLRPPANCLLIITSRHPLAVSGMYNKHLEKLLPKDAEALLHEIAPRIEAEAVTVAKLLDFLPMALRPAASLLNKHDMLSPARLVERLRDKKRRLELFDTERNMSVEASFSLSYEMLGDELSQRWRTLAAFPGTFDENAAAALWQTETIDAGDLLAELRAYSLLEWDEKNKRISLHDLARDYADACLDEDERVVAQRRHALYYASMLNTAYSLYLKGHENIALGLSLFDLESSNIRAGQAWTASNADQNEEAARMCIAYANNGAAVLFLRLHPRELIQWFKKASELAHALAFQHDESIALGGLGDAYLNLDEYERAIDYLKQALAIARQIGDRVNEGVFLAKLGDAYLNLGEHKRAIECLELSLAIARQTGDRMNEGMCLGRLGNAYLGLGKYKRAIDYLKQALAITRETGDRQGEGACLGWLGNAYRKLGKLSEAQKLMEQSLVMFEEIESPNANVVNQWLEELRARK